MGNRFIHGNHFHHSKLIPLGKLKRLLLLGWWVDLSTEEWIKK